MTDSGDPTSAVSDPDGVPGAWASNGEVDIWYQRFPAPSGSTPLLLINGLGSPSVAYQGGFIDELVAAGFEVVRFDNRDVGRSSRMVSTSLSDPGYRLDDMALDAVAVLDAVGWEQAVVFGQSMGGMVAQELVIRHPSRALGLVSLMSGTGTAATGSTDESVREALLVVPPDDRTGWIASRVESEQFWASPEHWDPAWVAAKGAEMFDHGVDPEGTTRQFRAVVASPDRDEALARLTTPTVVIHGTDDTLINVAAGRHTAACIPGSRYVEIAGLGHDLPPAFWKQIAAEAARLIT